MKAAFVLTAHIPTDERVFYHQKPALEQRGCEVHIISTKAGRQTDSGFHCFNDKNLPKKKVIERIGQLLLKIEPEIIICDTPISILGANYYRRKSKSKSRIFYDITEFYPSKKNIEGLSLFMRIIKYMVLVLLNFYADLKVDGFIFGEYYKSKPYRFIFPFKPFVFLPYYPDLNFLKQYPVNKIDKECHLLYCGNLTRDKGYDKVLEVARLVALKHPEVHFILTIINYTKSTFILERFPDNLEIKFFPFKPFPDFCNKIGKFDIYLDLRKINRENNRCLPIKLFYYMSCGRAIIFSNLKAIRHDLPEATQFGFLVNPKDANSIVDIISQYITDGNLYNKHCKRALELSSDKYHWDSIKDGFVDFVLKDEYHKS